MFEACILYVLIASFGLCVLVKHKTLKSSVLHGGKERLDRL